MACDNGRMPKNRKPGRRYGRGEANRRTRRQKDLDPRLRAILHLVTYAHVPLCRAERGYANPETMGEADYIRRARNRDVSVLQDLVTASLEKLYDARDMLVAWSQDDVASRDQVDDARHHRGRERLDVESFTRARPQDGERLPRQTQPLAGHVMRLRGRADRDGSVGRRDAAQDECVE
jgi:hypothetical protein